MNTTNQTTAAERLAKAAADLRRFPDVPVEHIADLMDELVEDVRTQAEGLTVWRQRSEQHLRRSNTSEARARLAIRHLRDILVNARTGDEMIEASHAGREFLQSINEA